jgi:ribosomal protein S12 methylthiotransferase accessory factor
METVKNDERTLAKLLAVCPNMNFIKHVNRIYQYYDEPKFYQYSAEIYVGDNETDGYVRKKWKTGGSSMFDEKIAFLKCIAEAIERYSCMRYKRKDLICSSFKKLNDRAVNPLLFSKFTESQKRTKNFCRFIYDENTPFCWVKSTSLKTNKHVLIPAQLVFLNYKLVDKRERYIDIPISTGAAFGTTFNEALARGFFELVERDAFAIMYMNKIPCPKVNLTKIKDYRIEHLLDQMKRYRLEVNMMDITTDLGIPSFAAVVINRTKIGPAVQVGIKSHFDPLQAMVGAFQESLHARCWIRFLYENKLSEYRNIKASEINSFEQRGIYWYKQNMCEKLNFWLDQEARPIIYPYVKKPFSGASMVARIKKILNKFDYNLYFVDLTPKQIAKTGCKVVKVISPDLQPHFFNEKYKLLGGRDF